MVQYMVDRMGGQLESSSLSSLIADPSVGTKVAALGEAAGSAIVGVGRFASCGWIFSSFCESRTPSPSIFSLLALPFCCSPVLLQFGKLES